MSAPFSESLVPKGGHLSIAGGWTLPQWYNILVLDLDLD